jgi:hypothetical protein
MSNKISNYIHKVSKNIGIRWLLFIALLIGIFSFLIIFNLLGINSSNIQNLSPSLYILYLIAVYIYILCPLFIITLTIDHEILEYYKEVSKPNGINHIQGWLLITIILLPIVIIAKISIMIKELFKSTDQN